MNPSFFNFPFRRKKNADEYDSELLSSNHRVTADTQRQKRQGCEENLSDVVLVIFFDWCFYYSNCTSPDNKNTFTLLSLSNVLQINLKTVFETSMGFKPRFSALALQCSANRAAKTHTLGAGQIIVEYILSCERNEA